MLKLIVPFFAIAWLFTIAAPAMAHPVPFSYVDVRIVAGEIELTVVAHIYDVAHELGIDASRSHRCDAPF